MEARHFSDARVHLTSLSTDNKVLAVVSFHAAEEQSADRPYHTDDEPDDETNEH